MTTPSPATDPLADVKVYQRVTAAGFPRPNGGTTDLGAVYATAILLGSPLLAAPDPAALWRQWSGVPAHNPTRLTGYLPGYTPGSTDPVWTRARDAVAAGDAIAAAQQVGGDVGRLPDKVGDALADPFGLAPIRALLGKLGDPKFLLRIAYGAGGVIAVVMGGYVLVQHTGAGPAISKATTTKERKPRR